MNRLRRAVGSTALDGYRFAVRLRAKAFSVAIGGSFAEFGARTVIQPPLRISGEQRIRIGSGVFIGANSWLQALGASHADTAIVIGDGTSIAGQLVISALMSVAVGRRVLIARGVYIADHGHVRSEHGRAVLDQGLTPPAAVEIGDGAWLGANVVIGPGVRVGRGAVVGANSVVLRDVPDCALAIGAPARIVDHEPLMAATEDVL